MKFTGKTYTSVQAMVDDLCDKEFAKDFATQVEDRKICRQLTLLRLKKGLTPHELSRRIPMSEREISGIENSYKDNWLTLRQIKMYLEGLGENLTIQL